MKIKTKKHVGKTPLTEKEVYKWFRDNCKDIDLVKYVPYVNNNQSLFRCRKCGKEWITSVASIKYRHSGCPICSRVLPEKFVKAEIRKKYKDIVLVEYAGFATSRDSLFRCRKCGYEWRTSIGYARSKKLKCRKCSLAGVKVEDVVKKLEQTRPNIELVEWGGSNHHLSRFRCKKCGYEWSVSLNQLNSCKGCGCARCSGVLKVDEETAKERLAETRPNITLVSYGGSASALSRFRCKCGHEWESSFRHVVGHSGVGCAKCRIYDSKYSYDEMVTEIKGRGIEVVEYGGSPYSFSQFRCSKCGYEWKAKLYLVYHSKCGCMGCYNIRRVWTVERIKEWLSQNKPDIELIEYGGGIVKYSKFKCKICGCEWSTKLFTVLKCVVGCPNWRLHQSLTKE